MTNVTYQQLKRSLSASERMPVIFLGHGSPMNIIEDNRYSRSWMELGASLPTPQAILVLSAHWMSQGSTLVDVSAQPRTIHDFYGFPKALYEEQYPAPGAPRLAREVVQLLDHINAHEDETWGLDHGAWALLKFLYPEANVPVFQVSIDVTKPLDWHLNLGKTLRELRHRGVLIIGSGNVVHNLRALDLDGHVHDWALEFDDKVGQALQTRLFSSLADTRELGSLLYQANPTLEHYVPALTVAGASDEQDRLFSITGGIELGAVSMRSFLFY